MAAAVFMLGTLAGCGSKQQAENAAPPQARAVSNTVQATPAATVTVASATPEEAVSSFLNALQTGDEKAAAALLTTKARQETAAHDMVVEPPGAPNASYSVGRVEHPGNNPDAAYVNCVWSEKYADGELESYEVVWVLRRETAGWRVAGMATQISDSEEPVFLDFEDLAAMEDAVEKADSAQDAAKRDLSAQKPADGSAVR